MDSLSIETITKVALEARTIRKSLYLICLSEANTTSNKREQSWFRQLVAALNTGYVEQVEG